VPLCVVATDAAVSSAPWRANTATLGEVLSAICSAVQFPPVPVQVGCVSAGIEPLVPFSGK
jgi:hypothetical protein